MCSCTEYEKSLCGPQMQRPPGPGPDLILVSVPAHDGILTLPRCMSRRPADLLATLTERDLAWPSPKQKQTRPSRFSTIPLSHGSLFHLVVCTSSRHGNSQTELTSTSRDGPETRTARAVIPNRARGGCEDFPVCSRGLCCVPSTTAHRARALTSMGRGFYVFQD